MIIVFKGVLNKKHSKSDLYLRDGKLIAKNLLIRLLAIAR